MTISKANDRRPTLADIAHVGPRTPGGEWLRRYWLAVFRSEDLKDIPQGIKVLGEDLVLFRDRTGQPGVLGLHCPHRGTSLEYGDIEDRGIRCPYHGWLFDVSGQCLEQPAEPKGSTFHQKVKHLSYPVKELGGLIFTYMGPKIDSPPPLPRYSALVRNDGCRAIFPPRIYDYNWFNFFENGPDILHACILHSVGGHATRSWGDRFFDRTNMPTFHAMETAYGVKIVSHKPSPIHDSEFVHIISAALPAIIQLPGRSEKESDDERTLFISPSDDDHFKVFSCDFHCGTDATFLQKRQHLRATEPPAAAKKEYDHRKHSPFRGQVWQEDVVCQSTQGTIGYRKGERLGDSDRGVILLRKIVLAAIKTVQRGGTPKGVLSRERANDVVRFESFIGVLKTRQLQNVRETSSSMVSS